MNAKTEKKIRREVKKIAKHDLESFTMKFAEEVAAMNLRERLLLCWRLLRMPRSKKP